MMFVFTAAIGDTSPVLAPAEVDRKARYICFSDRPVNVPPYHWVRVPPAADPKLASRRLKVLADHPALSGASELLWHDASYRLLVRPRWATKWLRRYEVVAMAHPRRGAIEDEARALCRWGYLPLNEALAIAAEYRAAGYKATGIITSNGLLARRVSPEVANFNRLWWVQVQRWSGRDQTSVDYAAWRAGIRIGHVAGAIRLNPYAAFRPTLEAAACP